MILSAAALALSFSTGSWLMAKSKKKKKKRTTNPRVDQLDDDDYITRTLSEKEVNVLQSYGMIDEENNNLFEKDGYILADLLGSRDKLGSQHLLLGNEDLGTEAKNNADLTNIVEERKILVETIKGLSRGSSAQTSGQLTNRTYSILTQNESYRNYITRIREHYRRQWTREGLLGNNRKVVVTNAWFSKALDASENQGDKNEGTFNAHFDNFGRSMTRVRVILTICDAEDMNKKMTFYCQKTGRVVSFDCSHGTVVGMDRLASGCDGQKYAHGVEGAGGTFTLCLELGIGNENTPDFLGDRVSCSEKRKGGRGGDLERMEQFKEFLEKH